MKIEEIRKSLKAIDDLYNSDTSGKFSILYSKLAAIELSSWIEFVMDDIVKNYWKKHSINTQLDKEIKEFIKYNNGFGYEKNFRPMLYKTIGLARVQKIEFLYSIEIDHLKTQLIDLTVDRNKAAHVFHHSGVTATFKAPSYIIGMFEQLHPILGKIKRYVEGIRKLR